MFTGLPNSIQVIGSDTTVNNAIVKKARFALGKGDRKPKDSAVVVMRRSRTASCRASLTVNRVLLGQST